MICDRREGEGEGGEGKVVFSSRSSVCGRGEGEGENGEWCFVVGEGRNKGTC